MTDKKKAAAKPEATDESVKEINDTFGGSPVTSDATGNGDGGTVKVDLSKIEIPKEAVKESGVSAAPTSLNDIEQADFDRNEKSLSQRAMDGGIGLIRVEGNDFRYVGVSPGLDKDAETPNGVKITSANSTFTPLSEISFDVSTRVKDPKTGEYYFPTEATNWDAVELNGSYLVPRETTREARQARLDAAVKQ